MTLRPAAGEFAVLVFDMARTGEPEGEHVVSGFATFEAARVSVEALRTPGQPAADLRSLWHLHGEDCSALGGGWNGRAELDRYIAPSRRRPPNATGRRWRRVRAANRDSKAKALFMTDRTRNARP